MPVTYVNIEWPGSENDQIYSPSGIIKAYFKPGETIAVHQFSTTCHQALHEASKRVYQKFGFMCTAAQAELNRIHEKCKNYDTFEHIKIISVK